jgi:hypothetical protein
MGRDGGSEEKGRRQEASALGDQVNKEAEPQNFMPSVSR